MKKITIFIFSCLFFYSLLFSAYDENKFMQAGKEMIAKGQYDNAIKVFNYMIKQNPKNVNAIVFGAFAYMKKGDKETAKKYLTVAYNISKDARIKKQIDALNAQQPVMTAQKPAAKKETFKPLSLALKTGINLANMTGDDVSSDASMFLGLCVGGSFTLSFNPWFSIQPEFYYTEKGSVAETSQTILSTTYSLKSSLNLSYFEIPLLAKLSIQTGSAFTPIIFAGPAVSILTNGIVINETSVNDNTTKIVRNVSSDLNAIDFGIAAGAGFEIKAGPGSFVLEGRYNMGLNTIYNVEGLSEQPDVKTSVITVMAGYSF